MPFIYLKKIFYLKVYNIENKDALKISEVFTLNELTPNCPKLGFCLFLKFGQAIVIRVLMLNF